MKAISIIVGGLCVAAACVFAPLWAPLVMAAWFTDLLNPTAARLERLLGSRRRAAAALLVLIAVGVILPLVAIIGALSGSAREFANQLRSAFEGQGSLDGALLGGGTVGAPPHVPNWAGLATRYGASAWSALTVAARASASAAIGTLVFLTALYTLIVDGQRAYAWLEAHAPISPAHLARFAAAFRETGRGLLVGGGGTSLAQGVVATIAYLAIGVPRALILGPLTALCSLIPFVGTALVWIPLAVGLVTSGHYGRAAILAACGIGIGVIDNILRPLLTRYGKLQMPTMVVLLSMLGGAALIGASGALLGPLLVRLCIEALAIQSQNRAEADAAQAPRSNRLP